MEKNVVLDMFRKRANEMDDHPSYQHLVDELASLPAESRGKLAKEDFDHLVELGAALYKAGLSQYEARDDIAELMRESMDEREGRLG